MLSKKKNSEKIDAAVGNAIDYEITVADLALRSNRRAWMVAWGAVLMSLILAGGYYYMLPLKEKVPYLIMADAYTGTSTVTRMQNSAMYQSMTASEAVNRSNIAHFILARESYDSSMIGARDWRTVFTMAGSDVAEQYTTYIKASNPQSPLNVYGNNEAIRVQILSITPIGGGGGQPPSGATVRFQRNLYNKRSGVSRPLDAKIATMEFRYNPNLSMSEEDRISNPLGFQVLNYRVENDYATSPPPQVPVNVPPPTFAPYDTISQQQVVMPQAQPQVQPQTVPGGVNAPQQGTLPATAGNSAPPGGGAPANPPTTSQPGPSGSNTQ